MRRGGRPLNYTGRAGGARAARGEAVRSRRVSRTTNGRARASSRPVARRTPSHQRSDSSRGSRYPRTHAHTSSHQIGPNRARCRREKLPRSPRGRPDGLGGAPTAGRTCDAALCAAMFASGPRDRPRAADAHRGPLLACWKADKWATNGCRNAADGAARRCKRGRRSICAGIRVAATLTTACGAS